jgi:hypothetical protein
MTKAAGTATSITAPYTAGTYKLCLVNSSGSKLGESAALLRVSGSAPTPTPGGPTATPVPGVTEAESYNSQSGIATETCGEGGLDVCNIENGDWIAFNNFNFSNNPTGFQARVASATSGGNIEIRLDSSTGTLLGTCAVAGTGGWQTYTTATCSVSGATGTHTLYLKFTGGSGYLFNVNWFQFTGSGGPTPTRTNTPTAGPSQTPTRTNTPPGPTATPGGSTCSPVTATITASFTQDGAGTFCWQATNLGSYINSWNLTNLTVNGVNFTNLYVAASALPAKINGYWYISYTSTVSYGHFEAK